MIILFSSTLFLKITALLGVGIFILMHFLSPFAMAADMKGDKFLTGYIVSILERELHWERNSYVFKIVNGVVRITLLKDDPTGRDAAYKLLTNIDGVRSITIVVKPAYAGKPGALSRFIGVSSEGEAFPMGDLFQPIIADPKQPQFFISIYFFNSPNAQYTTASVGFGETFGMYRFFGNIGGDGLQLNMEGALFAQFNLETSSYDLINADYTIGIPATYRNGNNSLRLRIYHQSSHLGDDSRKIVITPEAFNFSYEAIDIIYSREWLAWRLYGGGEYMVHKATKGELKPAGGHWGMEYRGPTQIFWNSRMIAGVDMKSLEEHTWTIDTSVKAGFEFGHPNPGQRRLRIMAEWYRGFDPRGQFYNNKVEYYGAEMSLGF